MTNLTLNPTVYRLTGDRLQPFDQANYFRAYKYPFADFEPVAVTIARNEIQSWFQTIHHFLDTGFPICVPARIFYVWNLEQQAIQESKGETLN